MAKEIQPEKSLEEKTLGLANEQLKQLKAIKEVLWGIFFLLALAGLLSLARLFLTI